MSLSTDHQTIQGYEKRHNPRHSSLLLNHSGLAGAMVFDDVMSVFDDIATIKNESSRHVFIGTMTDNEKVFCKLYREQGLIAWFKRLVFSSKAETAHQRVKTVVDLGLPSPKSLGFIHSGRGINFLSYHFSEYIDGAETLESQLREGQFSVQELDEVLMTIIQSLALLHDTGYCHGDTKLSNFICRQKDVFFVDLDGFGTISNKRKPERDLARFFVGLSELKVLKGNYRLLVTRYCEKRHIDPQNLVSKIEVFISKFQSNHKEKYGRIPANIELSN